MIFLSLFARNHKSYPESQFPHPNAAFSEKSYINMRSLQQFSKWLVKETSCFESIAKSRSAILLHFTCGVFKFFLPLLCCFFFSSILFHSFYLFQFSCSVHIVLHSLLIDSNDIIFLPSSPRM